MIVFLIMCRIFFVANTNTSRHIIIEEEKLQCASHAKDDSTIIFITYRYRTVAAAAVAVAAIATIPL